MGLVVQFVWCENDPLGFADKESTRKLRRSFVVQLWYNAIINLLSSVKNYMICTQILVCGVYNECLVHSVATYSGFLDDIKMHNLQLTCLIDVVTLVRCYWNSEASHDSRG